MRRKIICTLLLVLGMQHAMAQEGVAEPALENVAPAEQVASDEEQQYLEWAGNIWNSINRQTGVIKLDSAGARLNIPENFYFLNAKDAETVLVDVWGNPPGRSVLGMLFPADVTPFDPDSWAVTIEYEEDGYIDDDNAADIDYNDLLADMQKDARAESKERKAAGYDAIELVGWAAHPYYDEQAHKLHWAKELQFGDDPEHVLNYNIRVLGRKGVLVLNFIAGMEQLPLIEDQVSNVLAMAEFDQGSRYADFNPDVDKVAAYGLGALVTGKLLAKTGIIAMALVFLKKFGVIILLGLGALVKSVFGRGKNK